MAAEALVVHINAVQGFLAQAKGSKSTEKILNAQRVHIEQALASVVLSPSEATRTVAGIRSLSFSPAVLESLTELVSERVALSPSPVAGRSKLQDFRTLAAFYTSEHWTRLLSESTTAGCKLNLLIEHSMVVGLRHPNQTTLQTIVGLYIGSTEGIAKGSAMSAPLKYSLLQHAKMLLRSKTKSAADAPGGVEVLPALPAQL